jgi:hypothetical protein
VEAIIRLGDSTSLLARGLATLRSEGFESGVRFDSNADSNGSGYSVIELKKDAPALGFGGERAGQKPQLEGTVPDGRGPSGTTGRREWDSVNALAKDGSASNGGSNGVGLPPERCGVPATGRSVHGSHGAWPRWRPALGRERLSGAAEGLSAARPVPNDAVDQPGSEPAIAKCR